MPPPPCFAWSPSPVKVRGRKRRTRIEGDENRFPEGAPMWLPLIVLVVLLVLAGLLVEQTLQPNWDQVPASFMALAPLQKVMALVVILLALYLMITVVVQSARAKRRGKERAV